MIYVIGIGPGDPSYGLLGQEAYFEKADRILGSERHLEILPPAYRDKGLVPPKKLAALAELLGSFGEDEEIPKRRLIIGFICNGRQYDREKGDGRSACEFKLKTNLAL